jgi:hypothetical protein
MPLTLDGGLACSALCDFALALLPWRLLLRFNMYNREKIGVAIAMSMGVLYVPHPLPVSKPNTNTTAPQRRHLLHREDDHHPRLLRRRF